MTDAAGRSIYHGISSGETQNLRSIQAEWYKLYSDEPSIQSSSLGGRRWNYEQVVEDPKPFLDAIRPLTAIPAYQYAINYILFQTGMGIGPENRRGFVAFLQKGNIRKDLGGQTDERYRLLVGRAEDEPEKIFTEDEFQIIWQVLTARLEGIFLANGCREILPWKSFFRGLLTSFNYAKLRYLALGLHMSLSDYEIFLQKVLKRTRTNFYDRDEVLVYLTLKCADRFGHNAYCTAYEQLQALYPQETVTAPAAEWESREPVELEDLYVDESVATPTRQLRDRLNNVIQTMTEAWEAEDGSHAVGSRSGDPFAEQQSGLQDYLRMAAWQNARLGRGEISRTAQKRFQVLWERLRESRLNEYWVGEQIREEKEWQLLQRRERGKSAVTLTVLYRTGTECFLPAGTRLCKAAGCLGASGETDVILSIPEDVCLPAVRTETVEIKVKALREAKNAKADQQQLALSLGVLPVFVNPNLLQEQAGREPENTFSGIHIESRELAKAVSAIQPGKGLRFYAQGKNKGLLLLTCHIGTFIPAGTRFWFELEGIRFEYESLEDTGGCVIDIPVEPLCFWAENVAGQQPGGKLLRDEALDKKKKLPKGARLQPVCDAKGGVTGLRDAYVSGGSALAFFADSRRKNYLTVLCEQDCHIPAGTIFRYQYRGAAFDFKTTQAVEHHSAARARIAVNWENAQAFQAAAEYANKRVEVLPTNTCFLREEITAPPGAKPPSGSCGQEEPFEIYLENKPLAVVPGANREEREYRPGDSAFLRHIYDTAAENAGKVDYYRGFPAYGDEYFLNTSQFRESRITQSQLSAPTADEERLRSMILTLKFLEYVWWDLEELKDPTNADIEGDIGGFVCEADREMLVCGLQPFTQYGFSYDAFLALLLNSDDPEALFQAVWSDSGELTVGL